MGNLHHHSLVAWQRADDLFIKLHRTVHERFPPMERFELSSQLRRAAYSVLANIVEGFARRYSRARLHFSTSPKDRSPRLGDELFHELETEVRAVGAPLAGLVRSTKTNLTVSTLCVAVAVLLGYFAM
jgi:hypothetical protein